MSINAEIYDGTQVSTGRRKPSDLVAEYDAKVAAIPEALAAFDAAGKAVVNACTIGGTFAGVNLKTGSIGQHEAAGALLKSAWRHCWALYGLEAIASAETRRRVHQMFEAPPAFTVDAIREQFGDLVMDPWGSILRGLAEVFSCLDPVFKSHEKMKVGVKGLPKRIILRSVAGYGRSVYRGEQLRDVLNALAAYQRKPLCEHAEISAILNNGEALLKPWTAPKTLYSPERDFPARGVWLKTFENGNGHLYFEQETLRDVNRALAEYYGDVLPDCPDERPSKAQASTAVSNDLQYYPTPRSVVDRLLDSANWNGRRVLEPSCGCGRIMDGLRAAGAQVFGVEVDPGRAAECEAKGHKVMRWNFLEVEPNASTGMSDFDEVVMNPPFSGRHYAKHVRHALRFLKPGGTLRAILPATARHDHGELDDLRPRWYDLPVGSFSASGTNINTCIAEISA